MHLPSSYEYRLLDVRLLVLCSPKKIGIAAHKWTVEYHNISTQCCSTHLLWFILVFSICWLCFWLNPGFPEFISKLFPPNNNSYCDDKVCMGNPKDSERLNTCPCGEFNCHVFFNICVSNLLDFYSFVIHRMERAKFVGWCFPWLQYNVWNGIFHDVDDFDFHF